MNENLKSVLKKAALGFVSTSPTLTTLKNVAQGSQASYERSKNFDAKGAQAEGYTPEEIEGYITEPYYAKVGKPKKKFDVQAAISAGYSEQEVQQHLQQNPNLQPTNLPSKGISNVVGEEVSRTGSGLAAPFKGAWDILAGGAKEMAGFYGGVLGVDGSQELYQSGREQADPAVRGAGNAVVNIGSAAAGPFKAMYRQASLLPETLKTAVFMDSPEDRKRLQEGAAESLKDMTSFARLAPVPPIQAAAGFIEGIAESKAGGETWQDALTRGSYRAAEGFTLTSLLNRMMTKKTPGSVLTQPEKNAFTRVIKPNKKELSSFNRGLQTSIDEIRKEGIPVKGLSDFKTGIVNAQKRIWGEVENGLKAAGDDATVQGSAISGELNKFIGNNPKLVRENPDLLLRKLSSVEKAYSGNIPLLEAEELLEATNARLQAHYSRMQVYGGANPTMQQAIDEALAKGLRQGIEDTLERAKLPSIAPLKRLYGDLKSVRKAVENRIPVQERLQQMSLQEQINIPAAVGAAGRVLAGDASGLYESAVRFGASKYVKYLANPETLMKNVFGLPKKTRIPVWAKTLMQSVLVKQMLDEQQQEPSAEQAQ